MPTKPARKRTTARARKPATKQTYVAFVLDESGSMGNVRKETIDGFNEQVNVIRKNAKKGGETTVSLFKFGCRPDSRPQEVYFNQKMSALLNISKETYAPFGMTPMYDGVGLALSRLEKFDKKGNIAFLVIVVSDGQENASTEWNAQMLAEKVDALQKTGRWTFVYIGANQDLTKVREVLRLHIQNTASFVGTSVGTQQMYAANAASTAAYFNAVRGADSTMTTTFVGPS